MEVRVATAGRAHGVRGQVVLRLRTDRPDLRFREGSVFQLADAVPGLPSSLTLASYRAVPAGAVAGFREITDRETAQSLSGASLMAQVDPEEEDGAWYPERLRGARVELPDGTPAGTVRDVITGGAQDLLEIAQQDGSAALIPFVRQLVPVVEAAVGRVVVDPPDGLLAARPAKSPSESPVGERGSPAGGGPAGRGGEQSPAGGADVAANGAPQPPRGPKTGSKSPSESPVGERGSPAGGGPAGRGGEQSPAGGADVAANGAPRPPRRPQTGSRDSGRHAD